MKVAVINVDFSQADIYVGQQQRSVINLNTVQELLVPVLPILMKMMVPYAILMALHAYRGSAPQEISNALHADIQ